MPRPDPDSCPNIKAILVAYNSLLAEIDSWFTAAAARHPEEVRCGKGCSGCCRGLFDITLLDALFLQQGFRTLPAAVRQKVLADADERVAGLRKKWPEFGHPFLLNHRPEEEWDALMPDDDETPCVLLDEQGRCRVYEQRPMTCRLHGLPLIDISGEVMHDEWCTENFVSTDPLQSANLRGEFDRFFRKEVKLGRELSQQLFGEVVYELDTLIPASLLIDFTQLD